MSRGPGLADNKGVFCTGRVIDDADLDGSLKALALSLPAERIVGQEMDVIDPTGVHLAREALRRAIASKWAPKAGRRTYWPWPAAARRSPSA